MTKDQTKEKTVTWNFADFLRMHGVLTIINANICFLRSFLIEVHSTNWIVFKKIITIYLPKKKWQNEQKASGSQLTLKLSFWNASRSCTWTPDCWKLFPGAKWKFPATLLTSKNPYILHPSPSSSLTLCRKPSLLHWVSHVTKNPKSL